MNMRQTAPLHVPLMSERRVGLIGALLVAIGPFSMSMYTPAMPEIVHYFDTTEALVKMTLSMFFAGFALAQLVCGPLSDGFGRKPVTYTFMMIYLLGSVLALFAPTIEMLILARFVQGIGAAAGIAIARAIVRDLFVGEQSSKVMNVIGIILSIGPAFAPTLGGIAIEFFDWHAVFLFMVLASVVITFVVRRFMVETVTRDLSRIRPAALLRSYATILRSGYFVLASLIFAGSNGALYTIATVLPFVMMDRIGLTPAQFGLGMLVQTGSFFVGALITRRVMPLFSASRIVPFGMSCILAGSVGLAVLPHVHEVSFLTIMGPLGCFAFGISFVMPAMSTAAMAPFPTMAGAAASMNGFFQMGGGMIGGIVAALIGDPVIAISIVIPTMGLTAVTSWLLWRRLPEPALARITID